MWEHSFSQGVSKGFPRMPLCQESRVSGSWRDILQVGWSGSDEECFQPGSLIFNTESVGSLISAITKFLWWSRDWCVLLRSRSLQKLNVCQWPKAPLNRCHFQQQQHSQQHNNNKKKTLSFSLIILTRNYFTFFEKRQIRKKKHSRCNYFKKIPHFSKTKKS